MVFNPLNTINEVKKLVDSELHTENVGIREEVREDIMIENFIAVMEVPHWEVHVIAKNINVLFIKDEDIVDLLCLLA